jgi:hypothetical protein
MKFKERFAMRKTLQLVITSLFIAMSSSTVLADEVKGLNIKEVFSNEKATGAIFTLQPGATMPSVARPGARAVYFIKGSKIQRIYDDGKVVTRDTKTGDTGYYDQPEDQAPYAIKNIGKGVFIAYVVNIK